MSEQYRQGDVFFERIEDIPTNLQKKEDSVLAYGEVTGHAHRVVNFDDCDMFVDPDGDIFVRSATEVKIGHEEHGQLKLPPGEWCVSRQREYDSIEAARERRVAD